MRDYYSNMRTGFEAGDYLAFGESGNAFIQFSSNKYGPRDGTWKFHLSMDAADVPRAWNIVAGLILQSDSGITAKVVIPDWLAKFSDPAYYQSGKMITLYARDNNTAAFYKEFVQKIEQRFHEEEIKPGPPVQSDRKINGSDYIFYRTDRDDKGEYFDAEDAMNLPPEKRYNPDNIFDPYYDFKIQPAPKIPSGRWTSVTNSAGQNAMYFNAHAMDESTLGRLVNSLKGSGIEPEIKMTSLDGGRRVISVSGADSLQALEDRLASAKNLDALGWYEVVNGKGQMARYLDMDSLQPDQLELIRLLLTELDIPHTIKNTSAPGKDKVLSILECDFILARDTGEKRKPQKPDPATGIASASNFDF